MANELEDQSEDLTEIPDTRLGFVTGITEDGLFFFQVISSNKEEEMSTEDVIVMESIASTALDIVQDQKKRRVGIGMSALEDAVGKLAKVIEHKLK